MKQNVIEVKSDNGMCEVHVSVQDGPAALLAGCCTIVTALYQSLDEYGPIMKKMFKETVASGLLFDDEKLKEMTEKVVCKDEDEANEMREKLLARKRLLDIMEQLNEKGKEK